MTEVFKGIGLVLGLFAEVLLSVFWWWGPLVLAGFIVAVWLRTTSPGTGRRRRPRQASPWAWILGEDEPVDEPVDEPRVPVGGAGAGDGPAPAPAVPVDDDDPETIALAVPLRADLDPRSRADMDR